MLAKRAIVLVDLAGKKAAHDVAPQQQVGELRCQPRRRLIAVAAFLDVGVGQKLQQKAQPRVQLHALWGGRFGLFGHQCHLVHHVVHEKAVCHG